MARLPPSRRRDMAGKIERIGSRLRAYLESLEGTDDDGLSDEDTPACWMLTAVMACDEAEARLTDDMPDYDGGST